MKLSVMNTADGKSKSEIEISEKTFGVEFNEPLVPRVRKCELCTNRVKGTGANPACAASCPPEALVFGRRARKA